MYLAAPSRGGSSFDLYVVRRENTDTAEKAGIFAGATMQTSFGSIVYGDCSLESLNTSSHGRNRCTEIKGETTCFGCMGRKLKDLQVSFPFES
jgi:hypothetical protein